MACAVASDLISSPPPPSIAMNLACCFRDPRLSADLPRVLLSHGFKYELFEHEAALLRRLRHRGGFDLVLLDIGNDTALEERILAWLTSRTGEPVPVVLLYLRWSAQKVALALESGADDCLAKPFECDELIARIKALLRRSACALQSLRIHLSGFVLDKAAGELSDRGSPIALTPREFALAWLLFTHVGVRLSREAISLAVWGTGIEIAGHALEQHVYQLRRKLRLDCDRGVIIRTAYGQGYRLEARGVRRNALVGTRGTEFGTAGVALPCTLADLQIG